MAQEQKQPQSRRTDEQEQVDPAVDTGLAQRREALDGDVDSILDEIDEVLESNAEDFVKSFIQKGGQ